MPFYGTLDFTPATGLRPSLEDVLTARGVKLRPGDKAALAFAEDLSDAIQVVTVAAKRAIAAIAAPINEWRRQLRTREELMALDDRTLADIGLARRDIPRLAAGLWTPENWKANAKQASATNVNKPQAVA